MGNMRGFNGWWGLLTLIFLAWAATAGICEATPLAINARSAVVMDMSDGKVLFEQNPDELIPPASLTKILTLYIVFEAIETGEIQLTDSVPVSAYAASMSGSRMGIRAGRRVPLEELIKGMAVVSGNDACVATAEYMSGSVDEFVRRMNAKARQLGMTRSHFVTPNGLPAKDQLTTAHDIAKLSVAYLTRFPDSLQIHSMQSYTYEKSSHHNANRLLGKCPGVDGLKTGFVCASGYNISATGKRGNVRMLAVVMGAPTPYVRLVETGKLLEAGFRSRGLGVENTSLAQTVGGRPSSSKVASVKRRGGSAGKTASARMVSKRGRKPADVCPATNPVSAGKVSTVATRGTGKAQPADRNKTAGKKNGKKTSVQQGSAGARAAVKASGPAKNGAKGASPTAMKKTSARGSSRMDSGNMPSTTRHSNIKKKNGTAEKPTT